MTTSTPTTPSARPARSPLLVSPEPLSERLHGPWALPPLHPQPLPRPSPPRLLRRLLLRSSLRSLLSLGNNLPPLLRLLPRLRRSFRLLPHRLLLLARSCLLLLAVRHTSSSVRTVGPTKR